MGTTKFRWPCSPVAGPFAVVLFPLESAGCACLAWPDAQVTLRSVPKVTLSPPLGLHCLESDPKVTLSPPSGLHCPESLPQVTLTPPLGLHHQARQCLSHLRQLLVDTCFIDFAMSNPFIERGKANPRIMIQVVK